MAFNAKGQLVTIHIGSAKMPEAAPTIMLIDPTTLKTLSTAMLPPRPPSGGTISFAGGYFYLDNNSNVVCVTADQTIEIYSTNGTIGRVTGYGLVRFIALGDVLNSVLPDSSGNIWYISQQGGVGYVEKATQAFYGGNVRNVLGANPNETSAISCQRRQRVDVYRDGLCVVLLSGLSRRRPEKHLAHDL